MFLHRSNGGQQLRPVDGLLTSRQGEGAIPVVVDAKEYSTACSPEPRILIADACSNSPGHDTVIVFGFPFESLIRKNTVWQGAATDRMCSCARPHICPGEGPPERYHISRCTVATSSDHGRLELASRGEAFPTADTSRECALHLQVPYHKTDAEGIPLSGSQTASFKEAHGDHFAARGVSWHCSSLWLWQACRCLPWIRCLSCRSGKTQSLPDLMEPPAFRSTRQSQVRSPLSREEGWRLPVPTHPLQ